MKICVGISGSIAAYRSVDFVKKLVEAGHEIRCVLTRGGKEFVSSRALETISGSPVLAEDAFDTTHFSTDHISTARWAEAFIVYGASANFIGRLESGMGDDFLTLQLLAFSGTVLIVPAMNPTMWKNPMVARNVAELLSHGYSFCGPVSGRVACGETGIGHIAPDEEILQQFNAKIGAKNFLPGLSGKKVLISAGPMRTQLDPVRFIQNRSSGKMGLSLAKGCKLLGAASVTVLLGPVSGDIANLYASSFKVTRYEGPEDYQNSLETLFPECDIFFSAAAVLDFESLPPERKIERSALQEMKELSIRIRSVPDVVARFGAKKSATQKVIAFAAESGTESEIVARAHGKMIKKSADAMIANPVWPGLGPDSDQNQVWILKPDKTTEKLGPADKTELSLPILRSLFEES